MATKAAATPAPSKAEVEAQIAKLEAQKAKDPDNAAKFRREIRALKKSIGTFVPRAERAPKAEVKAKATKTAVEKAAKPAPKAKRKTAAA